MKKFKEQMMASKKWKATLLGIVAMTISFIGVLFILDQTKLSFNGQATSLFGMYAAGLVSIVTAYIGLKMLGEKKSDV